MMPENLGRPYLQHTVVDLEAIADAQWADLQSLCAVGVELFHRKTARAIALRTRVVERVTELVNQGFSWPSTDASPTDSSSQLFIDAPSTGLLAYLGYRVGANGLDPEERCQLLDTVYTHLLPPLNSADYMSEWAEPSSAQRLRKMADSIAAFVRNNKRKSQPSTQSIDDWEDDLQYLYTNYYVGRYNFFWPNTRS